MRTRTFILIAAVTAALLGSGGALYAYDSAREDRIAKGIRVGGVDLGDLTAREAQARLEREILEPLRRPIVVHHDKKTWMLGAREARIAADLGAMVDQAVARSREGSFVTRSFRDLTGGEIDADLRPTVDYEPRAVVRLLDRVRRSIERPAKDAKVTFNGDGVRRVASREGLAVRATQLHREIRRAIVSPRADRTFVARTRRTKPEVSTDALEDKYRTALIVNRGSFRLRLYKRLKLSKTYPIAVGQVGLETPAGLYRVQNKAINPAWSVPDSDWAGELAGRVIPGGTPENPLKARWLGIYDGAGIHGTDAVNSIGTAASHGCIRMRIPDVVELYEDVPVGAPVYIA